MVINPGEITLELLLVNPIHYMLFIYVGSVILGAIGAWWADRQADNRMKHNEKTEHPELTKDQLDNVYEFENVKDPIIAGILATVVVVFPLASSLDQINGWQMIFASAVLAGITARTVLMKLAIARTGQKEKENKRNMVI